jgi:hypothetical protein
MIDLMFVYNLQNRGRRVIGSTSQSIFTALKQFKTKFSETCYKITFHQIEKVVI